MHTHFFTHYTTNKRHKSHNTHTRRHTHSKCGTQTGSSKTSSTRDGTRAEERVAWRFYTPHTKTLSHSHDSPLFVDIYESPSRNKASRAPRKKSAVQCAALSPRPCVMPSSMCDLGLCFSQADKEEDPSLPPSWPQERRATPIFKPACPGARCA